MPLASTVINDAEHNKHLSSISCCAVIPLGLSLGGLVDSARCDLSSAASVRQNQPYSPPAFLASFASRLLHLASSAQPFTFASFAFFAFQRHIPLAMTRQA
jgi:hypothetical protein